MKLKQIICLILALIMSLSVLAACANTGSSDDTSGGSDSTTPAGTEQNSSETTAPDTDPAPVEEEYYAYLFAYFTGNAPEEERVCYAVSTDGYKYKPLNRGKPILTSESGTKCIRDPYIFKGHDGAYYMIATDMKSWDGWDSNRNLISWRSEDLINWTDETIIRINGKYSTTKNTLRAWAPQAIWNEERGEYMIYFALKSDYTQGKTIMYYAYSPDLKTLSTEPAELFAPSNGHDAIDSDIIYHNGLYYMFFKDETSGGIRLTTSDHMDGGYSWKDSKLVSPKGLAVEGSSTYPLFDGNGWLLISDAYTSGYFIMAHSDDLENFDQLDQSEFKFAGFTPRHGSVIPITKAQYDALKDAF